MMDRKSCMAVAIALANKMARQSWTMLQGKAPYARLTQTGWMKGV